MCVGRGWGELSGTWAPLEQHQMSLFHPPASGGGGGEVGGAEEQRTEAAWLRLGGVEWVS